MLPKQAVSLGLEFQPATAERWRDFEKLFGERGACGGCWSPEGRVVEYAKEHGARIVEGYPVELKQDKLPDAFVYTGLASAFRQAGFVEVFRRPETRPIMRFVIWPK